MGRVKRLLRKLFRRDKPKPIVAYMDTDSIHLTVSTQDAPRIRQKLGEVQQKQEETIEEWRARREHRKQIQEMFEEPSPSAIHQPVGRFMKHGKQLPGYRKSTKTKISPEEEEDNANLSEA